MPWLAGYPRGKIDWFPTMDIEKCVKCGVCMNCGKNVYNWAENGPVVARPYDCVPDRNTCAILCMGDTISFPSREYKREIYEREKI